MELDFYKEFNIPSYARLDEIQGILLKERRAWEKREQTVPVEARKKLVLLDAADKVFENENARRQYDLGLEESKRSQKKETATDRIPVVVEPQRWTQKEVVSPPKPPPGRRYAFNELTYGKAWIYVLVFSVFPLVYGCVQYSLSAGSLSEFKFVDFLFAKKLIQFYLGKNIMQGILVFSVFSFAFAFLPLLLSRGNYRHAVEALFLPDAATNNGFAGHLALLGWIAFFGRVNYLVEYFAWGVGVFVIIAGVVFCIIVAAKNDLLQYWPFWLIIGLFLVIWSIVKSYW